METETVCVNVWHERLPIGLFILSYGSGTRSRRRLNRSDGARFGEQLDAFARSSRNRPDDRQSDEQFRDVEPASNGRVLDAWKRKPQNDREYVHEFVHRRRDDLIRDRKMVLGSHARRGIYRNGGRSDETDNESFRAIERRSLSRYLRNWHEIQRIRKRYLLRSTIGLRLHLEHRRRHRRCHRRR